ncbi:MAG: hypothetical protein K8R58_00780 [Bacteroidales bacterium]|nr:hypothetical protein [Bacteroidales bacterium]
MDKAISKNELINPMNEFQDSIERFLDELSKFEKYYTKRKRSKKRQKLNSLKKLNLL